ncbi:hypothetical protein [Kineococcus sp. SYSU DK018]|uniref:hypothetical protein n=1 Tax=Kineococcus sp. SYSU DK018 TaxID=3383139 RepID=UPI003D7C96D9
MNTPTKLGAFGLGLLAVFGAAAGIGAAVGPVGPATAPHGSATHTGPHEEPPAAAAQGAPTATGAALPGGLQVSQDGYTLDVPGELPAGSATPLSFRVLGPDGRPVTAYDTAHDEDLHLIAVRRDLTGYQHVHPRLSDDGTWSVPLDLTAGTWRVFADFDPAGEDAALVLGADVAVAGDHEPRPLPAPSTTAEVDGYTVTLDGQLLAGRESELTLSVSRDDGPVGDLQPYLGAYGHLVALRAGDLAHLHVHPAGGPGDGTTAPGPDVTFHATAPSAGAYRLFLDFQHGDLVRTAEFTVHVGGTASASGAGTAEDTGDDGHEHDHG